MATATMEQYKTYDVPMEEILSDAEFNCRGQIAPIDVVDLARSISETTLQQPIVLQPFTMKTNPKIKYRIVAGHRRHMAFKINKQPTIPAMVRTDLDEFSARLFNLTENLKRKDLNLLQEARAIEHFVRAGWQQETIAAKTGMSRGWVQVRMMLLSLPPDIQKEAAAGTLTQEHVRKIYGMKSNEERYAAIRLIKERKERGEVAKLEVKKPIKPNEKKERNSLEMSSLQDHIQEQTGNDIITRVLGWALGYVSNLEVHRDLRDYYAEQGKKYSLPKDMVEKMF